MKSKTTAYLLWFFFGFIGVHKFYLNKVGMGIIYILTLGIFGIGWFIDLFTLGNQVDIYNALLQGRSNPYVNNNINNNVNNVVVNVTSNDKHAPQQGTTYSVHEQLDKLNDLKVKGVLTEEEFNAQKLKILNS